MNTSNTPPLSRRAWLSHAAVAAVLGATGARAADSPSSASRPVLEGAPTSLGARVYDVRTFGAKGDGASLDTAGIQAAIDRCTQDQGGTVLIPAGVFLTGTLELKSNVTLHLAAQGKLLGSGNATDYRAGRGVPTSNGNMVLLSASDAENVSIEGLGTIDGNGAKFFNGRGDNTGPGQNSAEGYFQRPHLLVFHRIRNLRLRDVFLTASAYHCTRLLECERVVIDGVRIHNRVNRNNDGFHFVSSRFVHLANCDVACQDDACALFGSNQFVTVTNCTFSTRWSVFRFGGGEPRNITVSNCIIHETYGCPIKMRCGSRSRMEDISFSNLIMRTVTGPISIGLDSSRSRRNAAPGSEPPARGVLRNISFNGIRAEVVAHGKQFADMAFEQGYRPGEDHTCITLNAVNGDTIEGISFTDVHVVYEGGGTAEEAAREVPPLAGEYFEIGPPPAYGLYARHVRGLALHNVRFEKRGADARPAIVFDGVNDVSALGLSAQGDNTAPALLRLINTSNVVGVALRALTPARQLLLQEGACTNIQIS
jgi:polygalacturonase